MLILTRHINEAILIGDNIKITVLQSGRRGAVSIGIDAPKDIEIWREELYERIKAERSQDQSAN